MSRIHVMTLLCVAPVLTYAETLERAKNEVRKENPSSGGSSSSSPSQRDQGSGYSSYSDDDDDDSFIGDLFVGIGFLVRQTFVWPGDPAGAAMGSMPYPYRDGWPGWYAPVARDEGGKIPGGQVYAEFGWIEDDLQRYTLGGHAMLSAFTIRTEWHRYVEAVADGHDTLTIGTIDAELGITALSYARVGLGVGATIYHDEVGTESGACVVLALQAFPLKPLVIDGMLTYSKVGDRGTELTTLRGTVGAVWNRYEVYAGWQLTSIGSVDLDGPTAVCGSGSDPHPTRNGEDGGRELVVG